MSIHLQLEDVGKRDFHSNESFLFRHVHASVDEAGIIHILGLSGQGKSTLLRVIGLLTPLDEGVIRLQGRPIHEWPAEKWRSTVSYVAQQAVMLPGSIEDNLRAVSRIQQKPFERQYARQLMEEVGLSHLEWDKEASQLSGGEKQRVALVRSLLLRPQVLLLDEPTAALDIHSAHAVEQLLTRLHQEGGMTLLWITHQLEQAQRWGQRIWFMAEGTLLEDAPAASFFRAPQSASARQFLQGNMAMLSERGEAHV